MIFWQFTVIGVLIPSSVRCCMASGFKRREMATDNLVPSSDMVEKDFGNTTALLDSIRQNGILQPLVDLRLQRRGAFRAILRLIANEGGDFAILTLQVADLTLKMFDLLVLVDGFTTTAEQLPDNQAKDTDGRHGDESYS